MSGALQAELIARLRAGAALVTTDKEERTRLVAEGAGFVFEAYDALVIGGPPVQRVALDSEAALLDWVRPRPDTEEGWTALVRALGGAPAAPPAEVGAVQFGVTPDGTPWVAHVEGAGARWVGGVSAAHLRVRVTLGDASPEHPASAGPFEWWMPARDGEGLAADVGARLADRLALARWLDLTAPIAFDGGTFTARHVDRYDTDGVGFLLDLAYADGRRVALPVNLARPGTDDLARELPAARTRLRRAALRA